MSKFIDALESKLHPSGDKMLRQRIPELTVDTAMVSVPWERLREYTFEVRYTTKQHCTPGELPDVFKIVKRQLREEIFGEFRRKLIELQRNIYGDNRQEALDTLNQIFDEIER